MDNVENQASITRWIDRTFPGTDPDSPRKSLRALEEMVELCIASGASPGEIASACRKTIHETIPQFSPSDWDIRKPDPDRIPSEAADVLIVLYGVAGMRGFDINTEVDRKMAVNRSRAWNTRGDGTGYHIAKAGADS